ncbi:MAG: hypothetical protein PHH08_02890, partial [Candidatus ainarchaeum sp.]|nr:hypothetical protein [Candidatus ainarchaeum sp.]
MQDTFFLMAVSMPRTASNPWAAWIFPAILLVILCIAVVLLWFFLHGRAAGRGFFKKKPVPAGKESPGFFGLLGGHFQRVKANTLFQKKRQLLDELEVAEQKFMKREILEENYKSLVRKKQQELIKIDLGLSKQVKGIVSESDL